MIKEYIEHHGGAKVFDYLDEKRDQLEQSIIELRAEEAETETTLQSGGNSDSILPENLRLLFVNKLADFTVRLFGYSPTKEQYIQVARSAVELVPQLRSNSANETVRNKTIIQCNGQPIFKNILKFQELLVNKLHGGSGYLYNRVRYLRKKQQKEQQVAEPQVEDESENESTEIDDFLFLKTTVVTDENRNDVEEKLKLTIEYRQNLLNDVNIDLMEHFPYFFVHPKLVNYRLLYFLSSCFNCYF